MSNFEALRSSAESIRLEPIIGKEQERPKEAIGSANGHNYIQIAPSEQNDQMRELAQLYQNHLPQWDKDIQQLETTLAKLENVTVSKDNGPVGKLALEVLQENTSSELEELKIIKESGERFVAKQNETNKSPQEKLSLNQLKDLVKQTDVKLAEVDKEILRLQGRINKLEKNAEIPAFKEELKILNEQLKQAQAQKTELSKELSSYQAQFQETKNKEFPSETLTAIKSGNTNDCQKLLYATREMADFSFISDLKKEKLSDDEAHNVINFLHDYLTKGFDLPTDNKSREALRKDVLQICNSIKWHNNIPEKLSQVEAAALHNLKSYSNDELVTQGNSVLKELTSVKGKNTDKSPLGKATQQGKIDRAIDRSANFLDQTKTATDPRVVDVRNKVTAELKKQSEGYDLSALSAQELADDISQYYQNEFLKIQGDELNDAHWRKDGKNETAPHMVNISNGLTDIASLLTDSVLRTYEKDKKKGMKMYTKMLEAADLALKQKNMMAYATITAAFSLNPLSRLNLDEKLERPEHQKIYQQMNDNRGLEKLQKEYSISGTPYVPYMAVKQRELEQVNSGSPVLSNHLESTANLKKGIKNEQDVLRRSPIVRNGNSRMTAKLASLTPDDRNQKEAQLDAISERIKPRKVIV